MYFVELKVDNAPHLVLLWIMGVLFFATDASGQGCRVHGSIAAGDKCYVKLPELTTWVEAGPACAAVGGTLAKFDDPDIFETAASKVVLECLNFWIGLNDRDEEAGSDPGGPWKWSDGSSMTWSNWTVGFPLGDLGIPVRDNVRSVVVLLHDGGVLQDMDLDCVATSLLGMINNPCDGPISSFEVLYPASYCAICTADPPSFFLDVPVCSNGGSPSPSQCFQALGTKQTWSEAEANCAGLGGGMSLASFPDGTDHDVIVAAATASSPGCDFFWTGLNDKTTEAYDDGGGPWQWVDGSSSSFRRWLVNFPVSDDQPGVELDCVAAVQIAGWQNYPCDTWPDNFPSPVIYPTTACPMCVMDTVTVGTGTPERRVTSLSTLD